ncbi:sugar ABC transporter ATP-binding protein [Kaistia algarum]|uniref:sugar ABC transporter ATP-binding protein n=1 Tax=Kaistia algarum TaxID=2083279 RepID=UPI00140273CB|nr:sugar ABC transporter ATP-binding protein [Kaistia algarum]MCX5515383.1 sugar ABC transporter ATP-binding protein [Kaistia algarum]
MLLEMQQIRKSFGAGPVLHGVDFQLVRGQIHALVGHNGAGKSTLMKTLGGNFADYDGRILIEGEEVTLHAPKQALEKGVAMIYQDFSLIPDLSVADNIGLGRDPRGRLPGLISHSALRKRSAEEAAALGIKLPMDTPVRQLGVAEQQMTEIVRACSRNARILVMDEPTARLAPAEREQLFSVMRRMAETRGVGIIYISHFLEEIRQVADVVTVMRDGKVVETGTGASYTVSQLARLLVGHGDIAAAPPRTAVRHAQESRPVLTLEGLSVAGRPPVDLTVAAGEIVGIAGLIGAGRTRLARAIIGDVASKGEVRLAGRELTRRSPQRSATAGLVMVPEDRKVSGLALASNIEENAAATALSPRLSRFGIIRAGQKRSLVESLIAKFGIQPPDRKRIVGTLSGGNAQKVLVARAVGARPKAMILDQPTAGVDVGAKAELHKIVELSAAEGAAILLISDDLDEILGLSDRVAIMVGGSVREILPRERLDRASLLAAISQGAPATA